MKQVLIVLRGAPASGKSTISKILRDSNNKVAWLKTDNFKPFFSDVGEFTDIMSKTALVSLSCLLDNNYLVIYEGIFQNPLFAKEAIELAKKKNIPFIVYQLTSSLETLQQRDKTRLGVKEGCRKPLGDETIERIYNEVNNNPIDGAIKLDTGNLSLNECLDIIKKNLD